MFVKVIGGGLAGSEAALQLAKYGFKVILYEMRPFKMTPAHKTSYFAELVCSNSFKSKSLFNAQGLLKEELKILGSFVLQVAYETQIPGGKALVVDREKFAKKITNLIETNPNIEIRREEVVEINPDEFTIISTGPLTSDKLSDNLKKLLGEEYLFFYDAISPIVDGDTIDMKKAYWKDRYGWDNESYLNLPMNKAQYEKFWEALVNAETVDIRDYEKKVFEACMPIEVMAKRGKDTLIFGPLKPEGLENPLTGEKPYAVVQLRPENKDKTAFSLVGFQTALKYSEQERVFRLIPGLENARFLRYGQIHRNTYINAPKVLTSTLNLKKYPFVFIAGQLSGTEGYLEAVAGGLIAALQIIALVKKGKTLPLPKESMIGALLWYISNYPYKNFQPVKAMFGLFENIPKHLKGQAKRKFIVNRAIENLKKWKKFYEDFIKS